MKTIQILKLFVIASLTIIVGCTKEAPRTTETATKAQEVVKVDEQAVPKPTLTMTIGGRRFQYLAFFHKLNNGSHLIPYESDEGLYAYLTSELKRNGMSAYGKVVLSSYADSTTGDKYDGEKYYRTVFYGIEFNLDVVSGDTTLHVVGEKGIASWGFNTYAPTGIYAHCPELLEVLASQIVGGRKPLVSHEELVEIPDVPDSLRIYF